MHRFWVEAKLSAGAEASLDPAEARHAGQVLRLRPGDPCELLGNGERWAGEIISLSADGGTVRVIAALPSAEPRLRITLFQGLPKGDKMESIIQKAVELGAEAIIPVAMSRCVVRLDAKDAARRRERWQRIAAEACKQSGRCALPEVKPFLTAKELPGAFRAFDAVLVPWEEAREGSLRTFAQKHPEVCRLAVVIGPEGGITPEEIAEMEKAGAQTVTLGPRILRTETAGMAAVAALMSLYGEMEASA